MLPDEQSDLIGTIYDTVLDPSLWQPALEQLAHFIGGCSAAIFWQDSSQQRAEVFYGWGEDAEYTRLYVEKYVHLNPLFPAMTFVEPGIVMGGADLIPHEEFRQTRFFKEWVAPQGLIDAGAVNLQRYSTAAASFSVRRSTAQGVMDAASLQRMQLITPHIRRAVHIGRQILVQNQQSLDFESILDATAAAVFLLAQNGHITFANQTGRAMLQAGDVVLQRDGHLAAADPQANRLLREAASGTLASTNGRRSVAIPLTHSPLRWLADVLPLSSGTRLAHGQEFGASAAIFVRRAEIPALSGVEILARLHRLTASEIRVLQAISGGGTVGEIADLLGVGVATVKSHLNSLFAKTGAKRQADLVREVAAHGGFFE